MDTQTNKRQYQRKPIRMDAELVIDRKVIMTGRVLDYSEGGFFFSPNPIPEDSLGDRPIFGTKALAGLTPDMPSTIIFSGNRLPCNIRWTGYSVANNAIGIGLQNTGM